MVSVRTLLSIGSTQLSREVTNMTTDKKPASDASRILRNPKSTKKEKEVAASDLSQRRGAGKKKKR